MLIVPFDFRSHRKSSYPMDLYILNDQSIYLDFDIVK
jgi:hypothetical protein